MKTVAMWAVGVAVAASLGGSASQAQPKGESRSAMLQKLVDCRKLTDESQRLACYDQATVALDQAEAKGDIVVVDREQARKVRRQAFGFSMPSLSLFERGETQEELENVTGVVALARVNGAGKWVIKLEDGAVWTQVDSKELFKEPKPGMPVKIRQASLGSFLMTVDTMGAFRARRTE
ncbi:MAG: hypothetical protein A2790_16390 [Phenylobacterium sp. RIFCSPHIGHO2_01_FULL_69_31]|jgi:hypothetical protein|uniref:hypothetical protein n=1 Tax=Phenylobacterium sp. RIFCSPHIGHO2_01_FULL_69_31 TaxID=1801944 RepID=UPI0008AE31F5|nr:hypothetical protein [Phenylobacterium sp. RIFCSPHIGHO2_01_FULL_69_31]OHB27608.1 MAG: hypothetical protein A2790_16390 [Phenylobacterium sp. RIFCSPHIGHO2_01_FULL_69_31]